MYTRRTSVRPQARDSTSSRQKAEEALVLSSYYGYLSRLTDSQTPPRRENELNKHQPGSTECAIRAEIDRLFTGANTADIDPMASPLFRRLAESGMYRCRTRSRRRPDWERAHDRDLSRRQRSLNSRGAKVSVPTRSTSIPLGKRVTILRSPRRGKSDAHKFETDHIGSQDASSCLRLDIREILEGEEKDERVGGSETVPLEKESENNIGWPAKEDCPESCKSKRRAKRNQKSVSVVSAWRRSCITPQHWMAREENSKLALHSTFHVSLWNTVGPELIYK